MINRLIILILFGLFVSFSGCVQEKALPVSPTVQPTTTFTEIYCVSNETGTNMSLSEAKKLAIDSEFGNQGTLKDTYVCNEGTSTWWIDMKPTIEKSGCYPAYVVNINTKAVEINWRCTGAILPNSSES